MRVGERDFLREKLRREFQEGLNEIDRAIIEEDDDRQEMIDLLLAVRLSLIGSTVRDFTALMKDIANARKEESENG